MQPAKAYVLLLGAAVVPTRLRAALEEVMATTRTAGITIDGIGRRTINKEYRGVRVFLRLGAVCQEHAERRLAQEIERLECDVERRTHARALFSDCANRFLA